MGPPRTRTETPINLPFPNIFFGGDAAFGPKNVITAVAHGHQAAISIDLFCQGKDLHDRPAPWTNLVNQKMGMQDWIYDSHVSDDKRYAVPTVDRVKSLKNRLVEVELGFSKKTGHEEAMRCLNCDVQTVFEYSTCIECDACVDICPEFCINFIENGDEDDLRSRLLAPADEQGAVALRFSSLAHRPGHGQGRECLPALRPLRRTLPDFLLGNDEVHL